MATDSSITLLTLGGLANRMRAIASAVALAHDTRRPLRVIWPVNNELRARFDDLFHPFHAGVDLHNVSEARALWLYRPARKRNLYLSPLLRAGRFTAVYSDDGSLRTENAPEILAAIKSARGSVLLRAGTFFYPCGNDAYRRLFKPVETVRAEADKVLALLGDDATGFHIRRTDNTVSITESPIEAFITEAENEFALHPGRKIYLATDDNEVKHLFHARFPGNSNHPGDGRPTLPIRDAARPHRDAGSRGLRPHHRLILQFILRGGRHFGRHPTASAPPGNVTGLRRITWPPPASISAESHTPPRRKLS